MRYQLYSGNRRIFAANSFSITMRFLDMARFLGMKGVLFDVVFDLTAPSLP